MKDKFQSLVGMRGACGWLNDPLITHLSPTNHPLKHYVWRVLTMVAFLFTFAIGQMWAAASTSSDGKYASGTVDFSTIGSLSANTTYWHNGIKFFSGNSTDVSANTSAWSEKVSIPAYISEKTASNQANKGKWGKNGNGKQYTMSGFACSQHTIGVHVNQPCTLTVVVNKNLASDTNDAGISASVDATAYATAWTTSTYKVAGDALTVASTRADATNAPGRYTLTIVITNENLTDGEAVVKMFNGSSGTGSGKLFCWESITVTAAAVTKHHVTYDLNGGDGTTPTQADVAEGAKFTLHDGTTGITPPSGKQFAGWNDGTKTYAGGAEYTMGADDVELTAQWEDPKTDPTATFSAGAYVVGASALNLSSLWSSNSDGAVTYALKVASDDATVSGTSFTATKAGSYVVTASQAATSTYNAIEKEATITVTWPATGAAVVLFNIATGTGNTELGTASKEAHSASINTLSNFTAAGDLTVSGLGAGKDGLSTKLQTLSEKDADKYIYVTFNVADGYLFTINSVTTKVVAVTSPKTIEVALSDATNNESLNYNQTNNSTAADHEFEFAGNAYEGTVTLKIYAYGAADHYRLAAPLTISGTVAVKPSPAAPTITVPTADSEAEYEIFDEITPLSITATGYPTPTYQWYKNSSASTEGATSISGAESATYTPANDAASDFYYYCVATNVSGSATSHYFRVHVLSCTPPTAPASLAASKTHTTANLSWDPLGAAAYGYKIALVSASGAGTFDWKTEATNAYAATGLTPETAYTFKVKSVGAPGQCESSDEVTVDFTTNAIPTYDVTFNMNGHGADIAKQVITEGEKATAPYVADVDGWVFGGWYTDNGTFESLFDFANTTINAATSLYAKWTADACAGERKSLSKVVLTSASAGTTTGYNGDEYAGTAVIAGLSDTKDAEIDASHEGVETGYKMNNGGSAIVFATLKKGSFQAGDKVVIGITKKQDSYKINSVSQNVLRVYYGTNASDATLLTTIENVSAAGYYTYRLTEADVTTIGEKKSIGLFRESSNGQNPYVYSVEITGCRSFAVTHQVTFNGNGYGNPIAAQYVEDGGKVTKPADPEETGYIFGGWYKEVGCTNAWDFANDIVEDDTELFAKWTVDPCTDRQSLSKVVLTSATEGTVNGYNSDEYAGTAVIYGLKDDNQTAEVDPSHEGVEEGYKLNNSKATVFATLKKGTFQEGDKVVVTITKANDAYKVEEVIQPILDIYYGDSKDDAVLLTTLNGVTAAGTYTYRLTAADVTAIGEKKGIGVHRPSSGRTQNQYVYSVEITGCRSWAVSHTVTFKNIDGTATIAAEPLEEGAYASTVAPVAPKIAMKRFLGWAEAIDGTPVELTSYTITEDKTLYAVYEDIVCPTNGTVYKFVIKDELPSENLPTSTDKDMSSYITATGDGYLTYTATANNKATINSDGTIQMKDASAAYLKVELECALAAGDQIRAHVTNNPMRVQVGTTYDSNKDLILAKNAYEFVAITSAMEGKQVLYITRSSNGNANLADFEIYRPAKYDVSFNMMGHGSAIADLEDVVEGSKIAAPSPAPTDADYSFAGWYKENTLENEWKFDVDVVETNTTLYAKWLDKSDATLKSLKYGETEIALEAGVYTYNVSLPAFTSAVPALTAETSNPSATKVIANAAAFDSEGNATSTVTVTPEVGADQVYTVNFAKGVEILLQDVTGSITWNFANAVTANVSITGTPQVLANYGGVTNDNTFESDKLEASGEKFTAGSNANLRANYLRFHTTVPGKLSISYSNTGGSNPARYIYVNGVKYDEEGSANTTPKGADSKVFVPAGDVELVMKDGEDASKNVQIYQMIFNATPDYTRDVTEGRYGTICLPNGGVMVGAELFEVAYYGATSQKVFLDNILSGEMEAGRPYIFLPKEGATQLAVFYTDEANALQGSHNGLIGFIGDAADEYFYIPAGEGNYILQNNLYREVLAGAQARILSNRAYIKLSAINPTEPALAPGRRRVSMSVLSEQVTTGMENTGFESEAPRKVLINGELFIIRGEKMFDAKGQLVK